MLDGTRLTFNLTFAPNATWNRWDMDLGHFLDFGKMNFQNAN